MSIEKEKVPKKQMTDEERLALAEKLDRELDEFINGLEKRQYTEGWPEDRWEEEMEKHPFFMKKAPEPGEELHPLLEGIQQLKYDPEENTAEELATSYKEDGNFNFKHKKYRLAILSYTEGIKQKHTNVDLQATLHNNRAAANFFLKNYRSCLRDCEIALRLKPDYKKALIRAATCCFEIAQYLRCVEFCDKILTENATDAAGLELRQKALLAQKEAERTARKQQRKQKFQCTADDAFLAQVKSCGVRVKGSLKPTAPQLKGGMVHFDDSGELVWPVAFVYPEYGVAEFVRGFSANTTLAEQLEEMLQEPAEWDPNHRYKVQTVSVYFEEMGSKDEEGNSGPVCLHPVSVKLKLAEILARPEYTVRSGTPTFMVLERGSAAEKRFIQRY